MNEVILSGVNKTIKGADILRGIDLKLHGGKIYGLYGSNGSGKTMLLRAIAGLIHIDSGSIVINGKQLHKDSDFPESIGVVIENPEFWDGYTGFENLKMLASIKKKINNDAIRNTLERVGLGPSDKRTVKKYSLGMKQKLGIAQAIMESPDIILLDEPTNALDKKSTENIRSIIAEEAARGAIVVVASHVEADLDICDIRYEMIDGEISYEE